MLAVDIGAAAGVPNFHDVPANAIAGRQWGTLEQMTIYKTTVSSRAVRLNTHDEGSSGSQEEDQGSPGAHVRALSRLRPGAHMSLLD